ncbi:MAG TPA: carboxymuconolactone decarboxylase family protein [Allosphingosinicella sp.]|nr:carboxymuconolactone decarboxylase family protein [Allosphingosinicella sp.]
MTPILNPFEAARAEMGAWLSWSRKAAEAIEPTLAHLVKIRASILNGCANCINMHTREARRDGETEQRLYLLSAWREAPVYSDRERAALAWTDALTLLATRGPPDESVHAELAAQFSEEEQVKLTLLINAISGWNRLAVGFHLFASDAELDALAA